MIVSHCSLKNAIRGKVVLGGVPLTPHPYLAEALPNLLREIVEFIFSLSAK